MVDQLLNGLTLGAQYALIAGGLALIFGVLGIVNFAHGEFYMLGAYALYVTQQLWGLPYMSAAAVAVLLMGVFGAVYYLVVLRTLLNRAWQIQLVATLATSLLLVNLVTVLVGPSPRLVTSPFTDVRVVILGGSVSMQRLLVLALTAVTFAAMYAYLFRARSGKALRAVSQNREAAEVVGIPAARIGLLATVAAAALAGVAAVMIAPLVNLQPTMGQLVALKAFAAVIMGGFGSVNGAVLAAFILGMVEALATGYITSDYADILVFGVMLTALLVRPHGLFGRVARA